MVCAPVRSIIPSLKLGDYLSVQAHKPISISHLEYHDLGLFRYIFYCILSYLVARQRFFIPSYLCTCIYKVCYEMKKSP